MSRGCLLPTPDAPFSQICSLSTCKLYMSNTVLVVNCTSTSTGGYELLSAKCINNKTSKSFEWIPPLINCTSARSNVSDFLGPIHPLRQLEHSLEIARVSALNLREKPFVALSIGMSLLSLILVFLMILGMCHRNPSANEAATARARHLADRRRRRAHSERQSVGCQAEQHHSPNRLPSSHVARPSLRLDSTMQSQLLSQCTDGDGLNEGFQDSEALLLHSGSTSPAEEDVDEHVCSQRDRTSPSNPPIQITVGSPLGVGNSSVLVERERSQRVFKGVPLLPSYKDAASTGIYCIVRDLHTPPPEYSKHWCPPDLSNDSIPNIFVGEVSSEADSQDIPHGSTCSMPNFSVMVDPISPLHDRTVEVIPSFTNSVENFPHR